MKGRGGLLRPGFRKGGLVGLLKRVLLRGYNRYQDFLLGIDADGVLSREAIGLSDPAYNYYVPSDHLTFRHAMRLVGIRAGEDVFLDYGSGKGRALLMAARYPFRRVLGVELSSNLVAASRVNIEGARRRGRLRCNDVSVFEADATAFVPPSDVTVAYFFSPFQAPIVAAVLDRLERSLAGRPRRLTIVYSNPEYFTAEAERRDWLQKVNEFAGPTGLPVSLYRSLP